MRPLHPSRVLTTVAALVALAATGSVQQPADGSPGGERIVYSTPLASGGAQVRTIAGDGSGVAKVDLPADLEDFNKTVWSHDGTRLLHSNVMVFDGGGDLVAFRPATSAPDGSAFHLLRLSQRPTDMYCSAWSPDDSRILCADQSGDIISIRATDGGGAHRLTTNPWDGGQDLAVGYSPDGTRLAWLRERPGATDDAEREALFVADADGTDARRLTRWGLLQAHEVAGANWSPDGTHIVSTTRRGRLVEVDVVAGGATPIAIDLRKSDFAVTPDYSPDGLHIVFAMFRNRPSDLYVANVDGSELRRITRTPSRTELFPDWALVN